MYKIHIKTYIHTSIKNIYEKIKNIYKKNLLGTKCVLNENNITLLKVYNSW